MSKESFNRLIKMHGYVNQPIASGIDLPGEIRKMKLAKNAVILGHYYITAELQDISDFLGDSLALAQQAQKTDADLILFVGVHFMGETAKILNPDKKVIVPDLNAGCSLAESAPAEAFQAFKIQHPDHKVISYINCSAEIKALSDVIVTSSKQEPDMKEAYALGANSYVVKPVDFDQFINAMSSLGLYWLLVNEPVK